VSLSYLLLLILAYGLKGTIFLYLDEPVDIILLQGQFIYQIYQSSVPYVLPLTIAQSTGVVIEEGRMVVSGPVGTSIYD
jgi:hypothetical protein